jgi:hypothetical protein
MSAVNRAELAICMRRLRDILRFCDPEATLTITNADVILELQPSEKMVFGYKEVAAKLDADFEIGINAGIV